MTKIVYFDYCALIIEIMILVSIFQRGLIRGRINRWYISIVAVLTTATIFDLVGMYSEVRGRSYYLTTFIANTISLLMTAALGVTICGYLYARTGIWMKLHARKFHKLFFYAPFLINFISLFFINPFLGIIFYVDNQGMYARGSQIALLYILTVVYVVNGVYTVIRYRRLFSIRKIISVFLLLGSTIIAMVIQIFYPNVIVQMFVNACAALILFFEVQAPEERIHAGTGLFSLNAYVQDVKCMFYSKVSFDVIIVAVTNYGVLIDMLGYFNALAVVELLAKKIIAKCRELRVDSDIYYLNDGRFAIVNDYRYSKRNFEIAQAINRLMTEDIEVDDSKIKILANVCAVRCPDDIDDPDFLVIADEVLVSEAYTGELRYAEKLFNRREFEIHRDFTRIIDDAFEKERLSIQYQPIYSVPDKRFVAAEAFIRLNDSVYGYVEPKLLISEAEKNMSVNAITAFEIEEVCKLIASPSFLLAGIDYIEINLSPIQCMWGDLVSVMAAMVRSYNVQPKRIWINVNDIDNLTDYKKMNDNLNALSEMGFTVVLDDFGAGVFEIERIVEMPLKEIKLDRSFVKSGFTKENMSVLRGTIRMINDMGVIAGAVGVEDVEMLQELITLGCTKMQGYYYSEPVDAVELVKFLIKKK